MTIGKYEYHTLRRIMHSSCLCYLDRCSLMGYDLNRHWNEVSSWSHPTLFSLKNYILQLDASQVFKNCTSDPCERKVTSELFYHY